MLLSTIKWELLISEAVDQSIFTLFSTAFAVKSSREIGSGLISLTIAHQILFAKSVKSLTVKVLAVGVAAGTKPCPAMNGYSQPGPGVVVEFALETHLCPIMLAFPLAAFSIVWYRIEISACDAAAAAL